MSSAARDLRRAEDDSGHQAVRRFRVRREGPGSAGTARASPWGVCLRAGPGRGRGHPGRPRRRVDSVVWAPQQGCYCGNGEDALSLSLRLASHPNAAARCQAGRVEAGPRAPAGPGVSVEPRTALSRPHSPGQATPKAVGPRGSSRGSRGALRRAPYGERLGAGGTGHPQTSGLLPPGAEAALGWAGGPGRLLGTAPPGGRCGARGLCFPCMPQCLARPAGFCD